VNPTTEKLGVGILGAGPVVQAIHLPTLARLPDKFTIRNIMDVNADVAKAVANQASAAYSTQIDDLLADDSVDVVAICSPPKFHAAQVIAALLAGKKAVLCEKPFATTRREAEQIAQVSADTGVPILVGAMHMFDPGWTAARDAWGDLPETAHTIRSSIVLPPNGRYEDFATEVVNRPGQQPHAARTAGSDSSVMTNLILGLAIHDLPLVRQFLPDFSSAQVTSASVLSPAGYCVSFGAGNRIVDLLAVIHSNWQFRWELDVLSDDTTLHIEFTPSYVHAGSATATISRSDGTSQTFGSYDHNGYVGEWLALHRLATGDTSGAPTLHSMIEDLTFAIDLSQAATAHLNSKVSQ
jgi:myo-inositol 2-dehydrogenase/D-chiro-inositol 1-dehydrogenase